jgi:hypothetical protein
LNVPETRFVSIRARSFQIAFNLKRESPSQTKALKQDCFNLKLSRSDAAERSNDRGVSSIEPDRVDSEVGGGEDVAYGLIISRGDRAELFGFREEVLDQTPRPAHLPRLVHLTVATDQEQRKAAAILLRADA